VLRRRDPQEKPNWRSELPGEDPADVSEGAPDLNRAVLRHVPKEDRYGDREAEGHDLFRQLEGFPPPPLPPIGDKEALAEGHPEELRLISLFVVILPVDQDGADVIGVEEEEGPERAPEVG
jgi:hypothetical protein